MASIIQGYEHDVFISYRQNDNKNDGWVTEFVANLKKELESTIKTKITIYTDENPVDGLLETHNVDKSLSAKLNSVIFIPVLSQTYCDTACYAWQHEFLTFNRLIKDDQIDGDVKLRNGNVAGRILPVRIHDLDSDDLKLLQDELGGPLRSIEFVYKEPGVNRPLRPDDNEDKNLNRTRYRNQVNKVANSIKEILYSIQNPEKQVISASDEFLTKISPYSKSIAVLPFVNMSNDPEQEYFSDGISEEIINTLVQIEGLKVAGRTSAFSFKNKNEDLRSIGEKLNVKTILEGSVRKSGSRIRINVQLIEAFTGFHIWSEKFDRELNDVFNLQDEIAKAIEEKLQVTFGEKPSKPKVTQHSQSVDAFELYLKGRSYTYRRGLHVFDALKCFEEALQIDPDYALALSGLADSYSLLSLHSYMSPEEAWPKAMMAAKHAVQIAPELAEVHASMATILILFERDWNRAESEYLTALKLNPRNIQARSWYAIFYLPHVKLDFEEACKHARMNVEYDPLSSYAQTIVCSTAIMADLYDEAIAAGKRSVEYDQDSFIGWYYLGLSNHAAGNISPAIQAYKKSLDISGRHNWALISLLSIYSEPSEYQQIREANLLYSELLTKERVGYASPSLLAIASAMLGKNEDAIRYSIQAMNRHDPFFIVASQERPDNKALRALPEFQSLIKAVGLPWFTSGDLIQVR
jgi:TolB-like protein/cytochrome c-type biogenesis protein CcmH/NrfG